MGPYETGYRDGWRQNAGSETHTTDATKFRTAGIIDTTSLITPSPRTRISSPGLRGRMSRRFLHCGTNGRLSAFCFPLFPSRTLVPSAQTARRWVEAIHIFRSHQLWALKAAGVVLFPNRTSVAMRTIASPYLSGKKATEPIKRVPFSRISARDSGSPPFPPLHNSHCVHTLERLAAHLRHSNRWRRRPTHGVGDCRVGISARIPEPAQTPLGIQPHDSAFRGCREKFLNAFMIPSTRVRITGPERRISRRRMSFTAPAIDVWRNGPSSGPPATLPGGCQPHKMLHRDREYR